MYYSLIKRNGIANEDSILIKNAILLEDTLDFGKIASVRNANGQDWWVILQEYFSNRFYLLLLSPFRNIDSK